VNWDAVTAITEAIGLILIIASLIYISVQTKQSNDHATASSEIAFIQAVNNVFKDWASNEETAAVLRKGFRSFDSLSKWEQALFSTRVGVLVNEMLLAESLVVRNLLNREFAEEIRKVTIAVLSTDGGLEYWEHDAKATPGGPDLLEQVKKARDTEPSITDILPWWKEE
jgi:hypothetical protein